MLFQFGFSFILIVIPFYRILRYNYIKFKVGLRVYRAPDQNFKMHLIRIITNINQCANHNQIEYLRRYSKIYFQWNIHSELCFFFFYKFITQIFYTYVSLFFDVIPRAASWRPRCCFGVGYIDQTPVICTYVSHIYIYLCYLWIHSVCCFTWFYSSDVELYWKQKV